MQNRHLALTAAKARLSALTMIYRAVSGHPGGSLSCLDLITALYFEEMKIDPENPGKEDRDRFVMSKGHCSPALYSILALRGFFSEQELEMFRRADGHMSGHVEMHHIKGVDMSTGSLGQGISAAVGMAMAGKKKKSDYRVYTMLGDGELDEGQVWEALMAAHKYRLSNLCVIVDSNGLQIDGTTEEVMPTEPLDKKMEAFGAHAIVIDGHNFSEITAAFAEARETQDKPTVIIARTVKGKGVSFMEHQAGWHGKAPDEQQYQKACAELEAQIAELKEDS